MKISEGIRRGSEGRFQVKGMWYTPDKKGVCAIGALMMTIDHSFVYRAFSALQDLLPNNNFLINEIKDRNDRGETFGQIIEWLESIGH